jgi:hypothetical protein
MDRKDHLEDLNIDGRTKNRFTEIREKGADWI